MQVLDGLKSHSFGRIGERPVEAGEGAEVGDITQVGLKEPDLLLLLGVVPEVGLRLAHPPCGAATPIAGTSPHTGLWTAVTRRDSR